ncbi:MAG: response regulator [Methylococcaceae bacterium]|nr:response regulator [Methylococcaceae bacterium]
MDPTHLQSECNDLHASEPLSVAVVGFSKEDEDSFNRFFQVARIDKPKYAAVSAVDKDSCQILIVNYDNPSALVEKETILGTHPLIQVVAVSRGPLNDPPVHHIRGMLFAARVLTTLDKINIEPIQQEKPDSRSTDFFTVHSSLVPETSLQAASVTVEPQISQPSFAKPVFEAEILPSNSISAGQQAQDTHSFLLPQTTVESSVNIESVSSKPEMADVAAAKSNEVVGYRALVVDDSVAIQKSLEINLSTLTQIGEIDFADSGESALEKAESKLYDLIFLDVMMPGIDGYETCTRLRKKPEYKKTPIIMVSGKTSPLDEVKGVMAGCTTYLTKPVQQEAFQKLSIRVLSWLEKQKKP